MRSAYLRTLLRSSLVFWLLSVAVFFIGRVVLFSAFIDETVKQNYANDLSALFLKGLQFDIKAASIMTAVLVVPGLLCLLARKAMTFYRYCLPKLLTAFLVIALAATVANFYYFQVYERQFDVFVFGLLEEGTSTVLATIWADYPVLPALAGLLAASWLLHRLFAWVAKRSETGEPKRSVVIVCTIAAVLALAVGSRGSLGKFPLRQDAAQISASVHLNRLIPNAVLALDWARKEHRNSQSFHPVSDEEGRALISRISGGQSHSVDLAQFYSETPVNQAVANKQPNVAFAVMESMGSHLLQLHNEKRDLLGRLAPHWQQDWVYRRFVSEGDGTSDTLHRLLVRSNLNLSQSKVKNKPFPGNMFQPYLDAGYRILFVTAGNGGWRDLDGFMRHLGVHEVVDENTLKARYPEARSDTWGVPDEFMFRYAAEQLAEAEKSGKPLFVLMLSITHHPPYRLPSVAQPGTTFQLSEQESSRFANLNQSGELNEILNTFRYANDQLGGFIQRVKQASPHTLIAATGDHNMRAIGYPKAEEAALGHAVPFYLYVPPAYRGQAVFEAQRPGSHKDIMPTLYELSLSGTRYYRTGCNLTAPKLNSYWCGYGYNTEVLLVEDGFYHLGNQKFYAWQPHEWLKAEDSGQPSAHADIIERGKAYTGFLNWQILRAISQQP